MTPRAAILVTGTEVLAGIIRDENGPWLSERLRERGVDVAHITVVGDRPEDIRAALAFCAEQRLDLVITSGGLGPTADDLTAQVVGEFCGRRTVLDTALEERIARILERLSARWRNLDRAALRAGNRKQAMVPEGATILEPVGTAPGLVVTPADGDGPPAFVVLPGPPRELQPMWAAALETPAVRAALAGADVLEQRFMRLFGIPESEIAATLLAVAAEGVPLDDLEVTTCMRRGEIEIATVFAPAAAAAYARFEQAVRARHADTLFSLDGSTVDEQVGALLDGRTIAVAESCTGGLLAGRLTARPGSSAYMVGGLVVYSNEAKVRMAGVDPALLAAHGAVSPPVASALAGGAMAAFGADVGVGVTGIAGPGGATEGKPVGYVCLSARTREAEAARDLTLPGDRDAVRDRTTTVALHLVRHLLLAEAEGAAA